jgi:hypothetical protein
MSLAGTLRREVLWLIGGVLLVDAVFAAAYFVADLRNMTDTAKLGFTVAWTLVTLAVVLRGLSRIRRLRLESRDSRR